VFVLHCTAFNLKGSVLPKTLVLAARIRRFIFVAVRESYAHKKQLICAVPASPSARSCAGQFFGCEWLKSVAKASLSGRHTPRQMPSAMDGSPALEARAKEMVSRRHPESAPIISTPGILYRLRLNL